MVYFFDYAYKDDVSLIETLSNTYGKFKGFLSKSLIYIVRIFSRGLASINSVIERTTPSLVSINCFIGRVWYKDQPVVCNSCSAQSY